MGLRDKQAMAREQGPCVEESHRRVVLKHDFCVNRASRDAAEDTIVLAPLLFFASCLVRFGNVLRRHAVSLLRLGHKPNRRSAWHIPLRGLSHPVRGGSGGSPCRENKRPAGFSRATD